MKKFLFCLFILTVGLSCTKDDPMVVCGCSPISAPTFTLIMKDSNNTDLLDPSRPGSFNKDHIKIYYKEAGVKNVPFIIRPPFSYGSNLQNKFPFHQLISTELATLRVSDRAQQFFVDLGDGKEHSLTFDYNMPKGYPENVKFDGAAVVQEPSLPEMYGKIYYLLR